MQDAGGENVEEHLQEVDAQYKASLPKLMGEDQAHRDPSRWWFASAAFPMVAGTLGPVASAFSICALVRPWRQNYTKGADIKTATFIKDPAWLIAINAVQLAIALSSNLALLLNMTRRLRFSVAQPVTIVGWYLSSICLIALASTTAGPLRPENNDFIWSEAYFYGIYAAVLYFVVASLMVATVWGSQQGHYAKDFMLTPSQRTLMLQTISFLIYLLIGALIFSNTEGWNYLDGVYWAAVTLFTVGFGDYYPTSTLGRALLFPYSLVGIISLGLVIGSIRTLMLERGKKRLDARMVEKLRHRVLSKMAKKGKDGILTPIRDANSDSPELSSSSGLTEFQRRQSEFELMRKIQKQATHRHRWIALAISTSTWLVLWLVGAKVFQECERQYQQLTYFDTFYMAYVSLTTIGYGDITPVSNAGKSFWVFWALLALPTMTVLISNAGDTIVKGIKDATDKVATVTILPSERGFKSEFKATFNALSHGKLFTEDIEESPPGIHGASQRHRYSSEENDDEGEQAQDRADVDAESANTGLIKQKQAKNARNEESHKRRVEGNAAEEDSGDCPDRAVRFDDSSTTSGTKGSNGRSKKMGNTDDENPCDQNSNSTPQLPEMTRAVSIPRQDLPQSPMDPAEYHLTLIEEIGLVMQHLKSHPPRKYTFQEWAWYLRLIGEDESDAAKHRKPHAHFRSSKDELEGKERAKWSWVGSRSPLMSSQEEAEWILERLIETLTDELRGVKAARRKNEMKNQKSQQTDTFMPGL
ncbi:potassium channel [Neurospora crassa]|uniref:Potassium channel protein n=2 Tax=Neurospora crassa TaxID=5141 RepID=Q7RZF3_NEUCR|nr:potassium channel protein [Neurospora crassa OR74A]EAA28444.2 potassium channel protein [Neurospora crassa OR74A]KHE81863.1 potassium channel [Neurospora crassa]CAD53325.1 potassium channel [Neurospora crassa]|eukprot:XP_957680.2 potassium channel protein [Neurospora crassa OR74A]